MQHHQEQYYQQQQHHHKPAALVPPCRNHQQQLYITCTSTKHRHNHTPVHNTLSMCMCVYVICVCVSHLHVHFIVDTRMNCSKQAMSHSHSLNWVILPGRDWLSLQWTFISPCHWRSTTNFRMIDQCCVQSVCVTVRACVTGVAIIEATEAIASVKILAAN